MFITLQNDGINAIVLTRMMNLNGMECNEAMIEVKGIASNSKWR